MIQNRAVISSLCTQKSKKKVSKNFKKNKESSRITKFAAEKVIPDKNWRKFQKYSHEH